MAEASLPFVRVSLESATALAAVTGAAGALNTALASFLLGDPFGDGDGEAHGDGDGKLTRVRIAGVTAVSAAAVAADSDKVLDLDLVAEAAVETVDDALWLVLRCLDGVRRLGVGSPAEREVERLQGTVEAIAELLPLAAPRGSAAPSGETPERC